MRSKGVRYVGSSEQFEYALNGFEQNELNQQNELKEQFTKAKVYLGIYKTFIKPLTIFVKKLIRDIRQGSKNTSMELKCYSKK